MSTRGVLQTAALWLEEEVGLGGLTLGCTALLTGAIIVQTDEAGKNFAWCATLQPSALIASFVLVPLMLGIQIFELRARNAKRTADAEREQQNAMLREQVDSLRGQAEQDGISLGQNIRNLLNGYLLAVAQGRLGFGAQTHNGERISLFVHNGKNALEMVARVTFNPAFDKIGRAQHPIKVGVIAHAWQHGSRFANDFPDPAADIDRYLQQHVAWGLSRTAASKLRMQSRLYYAHRIDVQHEPRAVLVIEALAPDRFMESALRAALRDEQEHLARMLQHLHPYIPTTDEAERLGF